MNTAKVLEFRPSLQSIEGGKKTKQANKSNSNLKSNGCPKPTKADPIRDTADINRIQRHFLEQGNFRNYMLVTLGISFALRAGDLLSLTLGDVYEEDGTPKEKFFINEEKTSKRRLVNINKVCRGILEEYWWELTESVNMADPLFPSRNRDKVTGQPKAITVQRLNQILAKAQKELDVADHMSSHCFRKTHAYQTMKRASNKQEALYAMQYKLNHSDARTTMIYCGIEDDLLRSLDEGVGDFLELEE